MELLLFPCPIHSYNSCKDRKVCKTQAGRLTKSLDKVVQSSITNYCKKDLFGCTKNIIIITQHNSKQEQKGTF